MTILRQTKEFSFSKTSGIPVDNISGDFRTLNKFIPGQFLIFFRRFFCPVTRGKLAIAIAAHLFGLG
jgi:hypothetical protein